MLEKNRTIIIKVDYREKGFWNWVKSLNGTYWQYEFTTKLDDLEILNITTKAIEESIDKEEKQKWDMLV